MYEPTNLGTHISVKKPMKQDFYGPRDKESGLSEGIGSLIFHLNDHIQSYEGKFIWNNMHGHGEYQWESLRSKYEGQFYANKKEGYGRLSYPSGAYFEGLYRNDQRFGPGIYTDAAGNQDVGIWVASKLIRLSRSFEFDKAMPRLAVKNEDKIRILQYRHIIHLEKEKIKHLAENLLEALTNSRNYQKSVVAKAEKLYNPLCKDDRAPSFNKPKYDRTFFGNESEEFTIDVLMTEKEIQQKILAAAEKLDAFKIKSSSIDVIPKISELKIVDEIINPEDNQIKKQYIEDKLTLNEEVEQLDSEIKNEEEESDYCGIKQIDLENINDTFLTGNYERLWNIFQHFNDIIPCDVSERLDANSLDDIKLRSLGENNVSEDEFDKFGRKKTKGARAMTKKVLVTGLLAWNNSPIMIDLLKHVFKHRNFETFLSFDISKVLAGRRGSFRHEGAHEKAALKLLKACFGGFQDEISRLILENNLNVDVSDNKGNTGLLLATAGDRLEAIETLLNLAANVDCINDECLTPLSLCILRLLELIHSVTNWSEAFLPNRMITQLIDDNEHYEQWHGRISYESLVHFSNNYKFSTDTIDVKLKIDEKKIVPNKMYNQKYIFDMAPTIRASVSQRKFKNNRIKNKSTKIEIKITQRRNTLAESKELKDGKQMEDYNNNEKSEKLEKIHATVLKLLKRGADPNFAQVPYPVLIMAIFTKMPSLLLELLEYGADPNTTLSKLDHYFTPLLILAILEPSYENSLMAKALLKAKANPSARADPAYRSDLMERLNQNRAPEFTDKFQGVTALHLLAIRPDIDTDVNEYLEALVRVFYEDGHIKNSDLYQGHSPLSLTIFEGNLTAAKTFLKTTFINVNEQLGADLGNAMLMIESCVLQELLPPDLLQAFLELMLEYGGCPLASAKVLEEEFNQIEYGRKELKKMLNLAESVTEIKGKKKINKSSRSKIPKSSNMVNFARSMDFVEKIAKEKLIRRIKANFIRDIMNSSISFSAMVKQPTILKEPLFNNSLTWMTAEEVAIVMKTMNYDRGIINKLVKLFVTAHILTNQTTSSEVYALIQNETERIMNKIMPLAEQKNHTLAGTDFKVKRTGGEKETRNFELIMMHSPESDPDSTKFKVCFECLSVHGKVLIICPKCKKVYFCSKECNEKNVTLEANLHQCSVFYEKEWIRLERIAVSSSIDPTSYTLEGIKNRKTYTDLEDKNERYEEQRGKGSLRNQNENTYINKSKFRDQESTINKESKEPNTKTFNVHTVNEPTEDNGYEYKYEDNNIHKIQVKEKTVRIKGESDNSNIRSKKKTKNNYISSSQNEEENDGNNRTKKINKTSHGLKRRDNQKIIGDIKRSAKLMKKSNGFSNNKDDKAKDETRRSTKGEKNIYQILNNEEQVEDKLKMKSKKGKKEGYNFNNKTNNFYKSVDNIKDDVQKKHKNEHNEREWRNNTNEQMTEKDSKASNGKDKNNKQYTENSTSKKYLDWLLKVNRSTGERFNIDTLLLPYVVFAQGDTYFRILPAHQHPKFVENYSLI